MKIARDAKHRYTVEGVEGHPPSVTGIVGIIDKSGPLIHWACGTTCDYIQNRLTEGDMSVNEVLALARKEATRQFKEAGDIGTATHELVDTWAKDPFAELTHDTPQVVTAYKAFLTWAESVSLNPLQSEVMVYNEKHHYAGCFDMIADIKCKGWRKPKRYLIDVKTGNAFYADTMGPQLAAYAECSDDKLQGIGIIRLDKKTGEPHWHDCTEDWKHHWNVFKTARELYRLVRGK
jgi:hypothetical protein